MKNIHKLLLLGCLFISLSNSLFAQSILNPNDSITEYDAGNPPAEPAYGEIGKWVRTKSLSWNSDSYKAYIYKGSCFRLKFPRSYDSIANDGKKYPIALVFHGGGEAGPITDNETDLYHGGQRYMNAVDNGIFDGYVLFMQSQGTWGVSSYEKIIDIINYMIINNKLDPFRITVNGLSAGGQACWDMLINYPTYTTAALPMSNISIGYKDTSVINKIKFTPIWDFQGELDGSPAPSTAEQVKDAVLTAGGNYRYSEYQDIGHDTWDRAFSEPDFFPFMSRAYSSNPWVLFGRSGFCAGDSINIILGLPSGFDGYEWRKNNEIIPDASSNTLQVNELGTYDARVLKNGLWSDWSHLPVQVVITPPTITPAIDISGVMSKVITAADGRNYVNLEIPGDNYISYQWKKLGNDSVIGVDKIYKAMQPGQYIASAMQQYGCSSTFSPPFYVVNAKGKKAPDAATNLTATSISSTEILLNWENNPHPLNNESFFEVYRSAQKDGNFSFITNVPADTLYYKDCRLSPGISYYYKIRAVNDSGAALISNIANAITLFDNTPPTAPGNLRIIYSTNTSIKIQWDSSSDNVGINNYDIYINGKKTYTTSATTLVVNALQPQQQYSFFVKAKDLSGNYSPQSNIASAPAIQKGLFYNYYEGFWTTIPDFSTLIPVSSGVSSNVDISLAKRQTQFAFSWQGYINVPATGTYTFETESDDGSKFWINTTDLNKKPLVSNDNTHNKRFKSGSIKLNKGCYPINIQYFQASHNKTMEVYWTNPAFFGDSVRHKIESKYFVYDYTPADSAPASPSNILASAIGYDKIKISWSHASNNNTVFQVYRSLKPNSGYSIIFTTAANITEYTDSGLSAKIKYYYKINAVNNYGTSEFTTYASATTLNMPAPPKAPKSLKTKALSSSLILLTWTDADSTEINYQVLRSALDTFNFKLAALLPANSTSFTDTGLYGNTSYFYKVNAINATSSSPDKPAVNAETKNNPPVINDKFTQEIIPCTIQTIINITATDADEDALNFGAINLPSFARLIDNGNGTASIIFNPSSLNKDTCESVNIYVNDKNGGSDTNAFKLIVTNNFSPVIDTIADYTLNEGDIVSIPLSASDQNTTDSLTWSVNGAPQNFTLISLSNGKANLLLKPGYAATGNYLVQVTVSDGNGGTASRQFNITINDKNPNEIVYIRFKNQDSIASPWNNITSVNTLNLKDSFNNVTNIALSLQTDWWATWHEGAETNNNSGIYPNAVLKDYYYFGTFGGPDTVVSKITGLDTSRLYDISFYGGSNWSGTENNGNTIYAIGTQSISLNVQNNTTNTADFKNIKPATDGSVTFTMLKDSNALSGYINSIVIKSLYADSLKPAAPTSLIASDSTGKGVQLVWNDIAYNETTYTVFRALNATGPFTTLATLSFNTTSYTDTNITGNKKYFYLVKALNAQGCSDASNIASIQTCDRVPVINAIANINIKNNQKATVNVIAKDDSTDHISLSANNLPSFVTFTDNGNGTGLFNIAPSNNITGAFENITVKATDNSNYSSSTSFNIIVTDKNVSSVYINFSDTTFAPAPWNNFDTLPVANATLSNLYDDDANLTSISIKLVNGFQGIVAAGMQASDEKSIYPAVVMRNALYEGTTQTDSIQISGLTKNVYYNFVFFNSHDDGLNGTTIFSINNKKAKLNATHNINTTDQINGVLADNNGQALIRISKDTLADYAYLNALIIQSYTKDITLLAPSDLRVTGTTRNSIHLQWADRSAKENNYEIWRTTDSTGNYSLLKQLKANITTYIDTNLNPGTTYYYVVRATNTDGQSDFSNAVSGTTYSQAVYINFTASNIASKPWNNTLALPEAGYIWNDLLDDSGTPSSISMEEIGEFAGIYNVGMRTGNISGIFSDNVTADSYGLFTGQTAQLKISGLNLNMKYDFTFSASSQAYGDVNTAYTINNKKAILNASFNTDGTVTIYDVTPDNNGEVVVSISPNSTLSQYGLIGALIIQEHFAAQTNIPLPQQTFAGQKSSTNSKSNNALVQTDKIEAKAFVYPNPFFQNFTVALSLTKQESLQIELYDASGKIICSKNFENILQGTQNLQINPGRKIPSGIYFVKIIYTNSKLVSYIKIIKQ